MQAGHQRQRIQVQTRTHGALIGGRRHLHLKRANGREHRIDLLRATTGRVWGHPTLFFVVWKHLRTSDKAVFQSKTIHEESDTYLGSYGNREWSELRVPTLIECMTWKYPNRLVLSEIPRQYVLEIWRDGADA